VRRVGIKYPKYSKKQDRRCKLTEKDIVDIRLAYSLGVPIFRLASRYAVNRNTIMYWTNKKYREHELRRGRLRPRHIKEKGWYRRHVERKLEIQPKEYRKYLRNKEKKRSDRRRNTKSYREYHIKYRKVHREGLKQYAREYLKTHREKLRRESRIRWKLWSLRKRMRELEINS